MRRFVLLSLALCVALPQAYGVAVVSENGDDISEWTEVDGDWQAIDGVIVRTAAQEANHTHALVLEDALDMTAVTFPVTLTYALKCETQGGGEIWTGIGLAAPDVTASNIEDGAVIIAMRDDNGSLGLMALLGGRAWLQTNANIAWKPDTWYTMRVVLSNPDFAAGKVDIDATLQEVGGADSTSISLAGAPSGNNFELDQANVAIFTRGSAAGVGGLRSFDNIVVEAANVPGGKVMLANDGTDISGWVQASGTWEVVNGAIVRTSPQSGDVTHALMKENVVSMIQADGVCLEYDVKVESLTTQSDETWTGIGMFAPSPTASNIESGAVVMAFRDGGAGSSQGRGLHVLVGGRAWLLREPNLLWNADTWYHMTITVTNADIGAGQCDIAATLSEVGGAGATSLVLEGVPASLGSTQVYDLDQGGLALFSRSGGAAEGGMRSFDNILVTAVGFKPIFRSFAEHYELYK